MDIKSSSTIVNVYENFTDKVDNADQIENEYGNNKKNGYYTIILISYIPCTLLILMILYYISQIYK